MLISVSISSFDTVNVIAMPWDVVPLHRPVLSDVTAGVGAVGPLHASTSARPTLSRQNLNIASNHVARLGIR